MTPFEQLAVAYFIVLLTAVPRAARPRRGALYVCGAIALVIVARFTLPWPARAWLAHGYLLLGYWIPAALTRPERNERFEQWLWRADARLTSRIADRKSHLLELAYLLCYPLVPAAFTIVFTFGTRADVEWFWLSVLGAGYLCYGTLPWTAARPPRLLASRESQPLPSGLARLNVELLGRVSHQLVTFPSGHVAVSVAAAVTVLRVWPEAGVVFCAVAAVIAGAAGAGRYHYAIDVLLGLLVGAVVLVFTALA